MTIDKLIVDITREFNTTTVINTHDMTTVMESGDNIIFLHQGKKRWQGSSEEIVQSEDEDLNNFIFASKFLQKAKEMQVLESEIGDEGAKEIVKDPKIVAPKKKGLW